MGVRDAPDVFRMVVADERERLCARGPGEGEDRAFRFGHTFQRTAGEREQQQLIAGAVQVGVGAAVGGEGEAAAVRRPGGVLDVEIAGCQRHGRSAIRRDHPEAAALLAQEARAFLAVTEAPDHARRAGGAGHLSLFIRIPSLGGRLRAVEEGDVRAIR